MTTGSVARRYAKALYELGSEKGSPLGLIRNIQNMAEVWAESEEFRDAIANPHIRLDTRRKILNQIASRLGLTPLASNFLNLLFDKMRLNELPGIAREIASIADKKQNRLRAEIVSAMPISEVEVEKLKYALEKATGKVVLITKQVDASLIGGVVTRVGDLMYDGSIKRQLKAVKENMLGHT